MNILHKVTRASLKKNRTRTLVTIIGIVLSMSLFTAVIEGAYSGLQFLINGEISSTGAFHAYYYDMTAGDMASVAHDSAIKDSAYWQQVGWAEIGSQNEYKPYLLINAVSDNITDLVAVHITQGRMPENDTEILLPMHLASNGNVHHELGDSLSLEVGDRVLGEDSLSAFSPFIQKEEQLSHLVSKQYTVVGFYERFDPRLEDYECPGYMALTCGSGTGSYSIFFSLKHPSSFYSYMKNHALSDNFIKHSALLEFSGAHGDSTVRLTTVLYGFAAVLIILIAFGSISLIYNSFAISVSERTKQFGLLKSIGATRKQIRSSVLYEALLLDCIAIPLGLLVGCAGIGITLYCLRDTFSSIFISEIHTQMKLVLNPWALLIAAIVCLITTLISAWIPARKAIRISAIDAIRQSQDTRLGRRDVKSFSLTHALFGFEGMMAAKNFRRNRKRYRSTVISLFLSVTLFISASSFCAYLQDSVSSEIDYPDVDLAYFMEDYDEAQSESTLALLSHADNITRSCYYISYDISLDFSRNIVSADYLSELSQRNIPSNTGDTENSNVKVIFLNDEEFKDLCTKNNLDPKVYLNASQPMGLMYNTMDMDYNYGSVYGSSHKQTVVSLLKSDALPCSGYNISLRDIPEYEQFDDFVDKEGKHVYRYFPRDVINRYYANGDERILDSEQALLVPAKEAEIAQPLSVDAFITELPFCVHPSKIPVIIYPYSMYFPLNDGGSELIFAFQSKNSTISYDSMKTLLNDSGMDTDPLYNIAAMYQVQERVLMVIRVFSYGFIILISLIAIANVFNTISTNILLRRREFAMLTSIGLANKSFHKMLNYECIIYGIRGLLWGLPASFLFTYALYRIARRGYDMVFYIPWYSIAIAVGSVFAVVFATMLYSARIIRRDNPIDALKNENL